MKIKFLSKYCLPTRTVKKMEEINNFSQEPDENLYQAWEQFKELLMKCPQHYLTDMQEVVLFYNGLDVPTRQILNSRGAIPSKTAADVKVAIQEMAEYSQNGTTKHLGPEKVNEKVYAAQVGCEQCKGGGYRATALGFYQRNNTNLLYQERMQSMEETLSKFMGESTKRHEENSKLIKEIRASMDAAIRNQGASMKTLEIQIGQMSKSISTIVEADSYLIRRIGSHQYAVSTGLKRILLYETKQTTIPFPSRLNGYYCKEKKGSYGP
ncbi:reverse transcriptase domain-containing protein [Tanacetum coccineum]